MHKDISYRFVQAELLDSMAADDPRAMRSRRDLRLINALMGNERWLLGQLRKHRSVAARGIVELGAGQGVFSVKMKQLLPEATVQAYDLVAAPQGLPDGIQWHQGDVTRLEPPATHGVLIANLFLHHFDDQSLHWLRPWIASAEVLLFNEPLRTRWSHVCGNLLHPLINEVTHYDMHTSIDAGFRRGELARIIGDDAQAWQIKEYEHWKGALRSVWVRS